MTYTLYVYKKTKTGEVLIRTMEYVNVSGNFMMDEAYGERVRYGSGYRVDWNQYINQQVTMGLAILTDSCIMVYMMRDKEIRAVIESVKAKILADKELLAVFIRLASK